MPVEGTEAAQRIEVDGVEVVLIEDPGRAVVERDGRVADGAVGGGHQGGDHHPQAVQVDHLGVLRLDEAIEAEIGEAPTQLVHGKVRKEDRRVLVDGAGQELGVEVVVMQVGDVQVIGRADRVEVDGLVAREGEPGPQVGRREPGVTENASPLGLDEQTGVTEKSHAHDPT